MSTPLTSIPLISKILAFASKDIKSAVRYSYTCSNWREVVEHYNLQLLRTILPNSCTLASSKTAATSLWSLIRVASATNIPWLVISLLQVFDHIHGLQKSVPNLSDAVGPLVAACSAGSLEIVKAFFEFAETREIFRDLVNERDLVGNTPLRVTLRNDFSNINNNTSSQEEQVKTQQIVELLVRNGASMTNDFTAGPFFDAIAGAKHFDDDSIAKTTERSLQFLKLLFVESPRGVYHADSLRMERIGLTGLMHAVRCEAFEAVKFLLEDLPRLAPNKVPKLDAKDSDQRTVFWHLCASMLAVPVSINDNYGSPAKSAKISRNLEILKLLIRAHRRFVGDDAPIVCEGMYKGWKGFTWDPKFRQIALLQNGAVNQEAIANVIGVDHAVTRIDRDILIRSKNLVSSLIEMTLHDEFVLANDHRVRLSWQILSTIVQNVHPSCLCDLNENGIPPLLFIVKNFSETIQVREEEHEPTETGFVHLFSKSRLDAHFEKIVSSRKFCGDKQDFARNWIAPFNVILNGILNAINNNNNDRFVFLRSVIPYTWAEQRHFFENRQNVDSTQSARMETKEEVLEYFKNDSCCGFNIFHVLCSWKRTNQFTEFMLKSVLNLLSAKMSSPSEEAKKGDNDDSSSSVLKEFRFCLFEQKCSTGQNKTAFSYLMSNYSDEEKRQKLLDQARPKATVVTENRGSRVSEDNFLEKVNARHQIIVNVLLESTLMKELINSDHDREFVIACFKEGIEEFENSMEIGFLSCYSPEVIEKVKKIQSSCLAKLRAFIL